MALSASNVFEFQSGGSMNNGGGFNATRDAVNGVDYSQQASPQLAKTDCYSHNDTGLHSDTGVFTHAMEGNLVKVVSGTNATVGWYEIVTYVSANEVTLDRKPVSADNSANKDMVVNVGGALAFGIAAQDTAFWTALIAGNTVWFSGGNTNPGTTYTIAGNISAGTAGTDPFPVRVRGYRATRGDACLGNYRPKIDCGAYTFAAANVLLWENLRMTGTGSSVFLPGYYDLMRNCSYQNTSTTDDQYAVNVAGSTGVHLIGCQASSKKGAAIRGSGANSTICFGCYIHDSKNAFIGNTASAHLINCVIDSVSNYGAAIGSYGSMVGNLLINCGYAWYEASTYQPLIVANNIFLHNWYAMYYTSSSPSNFVDHNCFYGNATDNYLDYAGVVVDSITSDPLVTATVGKGTDGASTAGTSVFTSASAPFAGVTTSDTLVIFTGTGTGIKVGVYGIVSVDSTSQLTLDSDPTNGVNNISACRFGVVKGTDFTLDAASPCIDAGLDASLFAGVTV